MHVLIKETIFERNVLSLPRFYDILINQSAPPLSSDEINIFEPDEALRDGVGIIGLEVIVVHLSLSELIFHLVGPSREDVHEEVARIHSTALLT